MRRLVPVHLCVIMGCEMSAVGVQGSAGVHGECLPALTPPSLANPRSLSVLHTNTGERVFCTDARAGKQSANVSECHACPSGGGRWVGIGQRNEARGGERRMLGQLVVRAHFHLFLFHLLSNLAHSCAF